MTKFLIDSENREPTRETVTVDYQSNNESVEGDSLIGRRRNQCPELFGHATNEVNGIKAKQAVTRIGFCDRPVVDTSLSLSLSLPLRKNLHQSAMVQLFHPATEPGTALRKSDDDRHIGHDSIPQAFARIFPPQALSDYTKEPISAPWIN